MIECFTSLICLCLVACCSESSSRPHQPSVLFFFIRCIASHFIPLREREMVLLMFFLLLLTVSLFVSHAYSLLPATLFFLFGLVCTWYDAYARIYIPSSSPSCIFTLCFLYPFYFFPPLSAVVPRPVTVPSKRWRRRPSLESRFSILSLILRLVTSLSH